VALPLIAIVGAPNVGKSTLFNRLVGRRRAIVTNEPGVTRDRMYDEVRETSIPFRIVDTGGLTPNTAVPFAQEIEAQADAALAEAVVFLFVVDARAGATALDLELAGILRRRNKPLLLIANKVDGDGAEALVHDLHVLRLGEPIGVSSEHGRGVDDLFTRIVAELEKCASRADPGGAFDLQDDDEESELSTEVKVAIVGRPNVGKSSLLNRLVGEQRAVVSDVAGTTRDAVDTLLTLDDKRYRLIDTAGIRRPGRVQQAVEKFSVNRARANIARCDAAVLVLDASEGFAAQDAHIAGYVREGGKPMVVVVNKWDLIEDRKEEAAEWEERVRHRLRFARDVPMILISAKSGQRVRQVLRRVDQVHAESGIRVPTVELNRWAAELSGFDGRTPAGGRGFKLYYATQIGVYPPRFLLFCNDPKRAHFSLERFLDNSLRERFGFGSAALQLMFRARRESNTP
jgi:GTP-binding protein